MITILTCIKENIYLKYKVKLKKEIHNDFNLEFIFDLFVLFCRFAVLFKDFLYNFFIEPKLEGKKQNYKQVY